MIAVLFACSKGKISPPCPSLIWDSSTTIEDWQSAWKSAEKEYTARQLYTGRAVKMQFEKVGQFSDVLEFVISAGAGLISSSGHPQLPSYEATFRTGKGPLISDWHKLPHGGLENIPLSVNRIVTFAPPSYHLALKADPLFQDISDKFVVASNSPLASSAGQVLALHPRSKEILGVSSSDLNSALLELYLNSEKPGFESLHKEASQLPPIEKRKRVNNEELKELIRGAPEFTSFMSLVRYIRDTIRVSASVERMRQMKLELDTDKL